MTQANVNLSTGEMTTGDEVMSTPKTTVNTEKVEYAKTQLESGSADVSLKTFVIGVGNAGNQALSDCLKAGFDVYAINTSIKDVSNSVLEAKIPCFIAGSEARGAGKNIDVGKSLWKENGRDLYNEDLFITKCQESDVIVVTAALGGGSGAAIAPEVCKVTQAMFPKKIVIYYGISPKNIGDGSKSKANAIRSISEIKDLGIPFLVDDLGVLEDMPNDKAYIEIDNHMVRSIKAFTGKYNAANRSQMIDENDNKTIISEQGLMAAYYVDGVTSKDLEDGKTLQSYIIEQIKKSPSIAIQKDGIVKQMGVIIECPEDMQETARTGNYSEITNFIGGRPVGQFENYTVTNGTSIRIIVILSGMTFPYNRIKQYTDDVIAEEERQKRVKEQDISLGNDLTAIADRNSDKLTSNTTASASHITAILDDFF